MVAALSDDGALYFDPSDTRGMADAAERVLADDVVIPLAAWRCSAGSGAQTIREGRQTIG